MKNNYFNFAALLLVAAIAFSFTTTIEEIISKGLDIKNSTIAWKGYKVTGEHAGTIKLKSGQLDFDGDKLTGGNFVIDMTTLNVTDLEGEWKDKLEGHLKSADFFGVEKYPTATFNITNVVSRGTPGSYKIVGDLTIKETTKTIKFQADMTENGDMAKAKITIDRSDFDIRYGSGSFFDSLGDKTIYDEFDLEISLAIAK